ncbi:MAG: WG repeat-containing protein [Cytophagia bacterium]|nr:MAG: WG repeat-containing protein [Cytophagia bacterium]TAG44259.1 MAG: WG repeat-containing protein [Cytophagia bacterium]
MNDEFGRLRAIVQSTEPKKREKTRKNLVFLSFCLCKSASIPIAKYILYTHQKKIKLYFIFFIVLLFYISKTIAQPTPDLIPYRKGNFWGYSDVYKKIKIPCEYEEVKLFVNELAKVKKNGKWGLIDKKGSIFVECEYDLIYGASKKHAIIVCKGGDKDGNNGKWGLIDNYKGEKIELKFDLIRECFLPNTWGAIKNGKWGIINRQAFWQVQPEFDVSTLENHPFKEEQIIDFGAKNNNVSNIYQKIRFFRERSRVGKNGFWGFINAYGNPLLPLEYDYVSEYNNDWVLVKKGKKIGFWHFDREKNIPLLYDWDKSHYLHQKFSENKVQVKKDGKWGYINANNEIIIDFKYYEAHSFENEVALVNTTPDILLPSWEIIDKNGKTIFQIDNQKYNILDYQFKGKALRLQEKNTKNIYLIDTKGAFLNEKQPYQQATFLYDGYWKIVDLNNKMGFWHDEIKKQIPLEYDFLKAINFNPEFKNGIFKLYKNQKCGLINTKNEEILPFIYEDIKFPIDFKPELPTLTRLCVKENNLWGVINLKGKKMIHYKYSSIMPFENGITKIKNKNEEVIGYIDGLGNEFWE